VSRNSGSQLDRIAACAASAVLPGAFEEAGFGAVRGSDIHAFLYGARRHGRDQALFATPTKFRDFCAAIDLDALKQYLTPSAVGEAAFIYNALSGETRYLGENIGRRYGELGLGDFPFSTDFYDEQDDEVVVLDVKTGRGETAHPREGWQYRLAGVGLTKRAALSQARLVRATLDEDAAWDFVEYDASMIDLDAWADELVSIAARLQAARAAVAAGRMPDVYPSESACRWCPCIKSCPSATGLVRHLPTEMQTLSDTMREMSVEQLGAGWPVYQRMKQLVEAIGEEYASILRETSLPLPNGKLLVLGETKREYIASDVALSVLVDKYGADVAQRATKASVSKESLKAAVGRDQFERALMLIREAGGVDVKMSLTPREEKAK
jgi:hypothetical protein